MTIELSMPGEELARRVLKTETGFDERLVGIKMSAMGGGNPTGLHSMAQAASFLHLGDYRMLMDPANKATVGYIDPQALAAWVEGVFGDEELARAIREIAGAAENYGQTVEPIKGLLESRLATCRTVLEVTEQV